MTLVNKQFSSQIEMLKWIERNKDDIASFKITAPLPDNPFVWPNWKVILAFMGPLSFVIGCFLIAAAVGDWW